MVDKKYSRISHILLGLLPKEYLLVEIFDLFNWEIIRFLHSMTCLQKKTMNLYKNCQSIMNEEN